MFGTNNHATLRLSEINTGASLALHHVHMPRYTNLLPRDWLIRILQLHRCTWQNAQFLTFETLTCSTWYCRVRARVGWLKMKSSGGRTDSGGMYEFNQQQWQCCPSKPLDLIYSFENQCCDFHSGMKELWKESGAYGKKLQSVCGRCTITSSKSSAR